MTIKEIISACATCIGREDVVEYLKNTSSSEIGKDTTSSVLVMVRLINIVLRELASSYVPMSVTEQIEIKNQRFDLSMLNESILEIVEIFDDYGNDLSYKIKGEYLIVASEKASIKYKYLPRNYDLDDVIGYDETQISKMILACGLAAEFKISEGNFEEAVMWHKRFVEGVSSICLPKNSKIKSRYWA